MAKKKQDDGSEVEADEELPESPKESFMEKIWPGVSADEGLVKVSKDGETLEVHPDTLEAHVKAGWTVV